jgi:hypothetical protein
LPPASDPGRRSHTRKLEWSWPMAKSVSQKLLASIIIDASRRDDRGLTSSLIWTLLVAQPPGVPKCTRSIHPAEAQRTVRSDALWM